MDFLVHPYLYKEDKGSQMRCGVKFPTNVLLSWVLIKFFFFFFSCLDTELEGTGVGEEKYRYVEKHHILAGEVQWIIYWQMGYRLHVDCSVSHGSFMYNFIKLFLHFTIQSLIFKLTSNIHFQNHSYSHSYGMKKRSSGSRKDPLVSFVVSHSTVSYAAVKFTDYF